MTSTLLKKKTKQIKHAKYDNEAFKKNEAPNFQGPTIILKLRLEFQTPNCCLFLKIK
jgi:hypothetical protein